MQIQEEHLLEKPKHIGNFKGHKLFRVSTVTGLHLIVKPDGNGFETFSAAPHPGIAKFLAERKHPEINWTELSKSESVFVDPNSPIVLKYEAITDQIRKFQGK